jgi:PAS domain S-box-containing protein
MVGMHDAWLVLLSVIVAITASFVALDLASRVVASQRSRTRWAWLTGGAISMGTGIWSMHFIGMLGFRLPAPLSYDVPITLLSLLIAVIASGFALILVTRGRLGAFRLLGGGMLMGIGIATMHYTGMAALRMNLPIRYQPYLFGLSILIAVAASVVALWSAFRLRLETILTAFWKKAGSAFVMGAAIYGMHYTGMAAAIFAPNSVSTVSPQHINHVGLAVTLGGFTLLFFTATLLISAFDAYLAERSTEHAKALRQAQDMLEARVVERTAELARTNQSLLEQIAERERAEEAIRQAQARTESVLNSMADTYILFDRHWRYLYVNEAAARAIGRPRERILGCTLWELYPDIVGTELERQYRRAMDERVPVACEFHYLTRGTWWENRFYPVPEGLAVFATNITERKVADERIRESEARLRAFMDHSPSVMFIKDFEGRYLHVNNQFQNRFGLTEQQIIGKTDDEIFDPEQAARFRANDKEVIDAGTPIEIEETAQYVDGPHVSIVYKFPISDARGHITAVGGIATDITERKRATRDLKAYADQLQKLSRRMVETQEIYRRELSRELHDRIGQNLTALNLNLHSLLNELPANFKPKLGPRLKDSMALASAMAENIEDVMSELRPSMLDEHGLLAALRWLSKRFTHRAGVPVARRRAAAADGSGRRNRVIPHRAGSVDQHRQARQGEARRYRRDGGAGQRFAFDRRRRNWLRCGLRNGA